MRKRYSRSYTVLSFLTMFSYREQPLGDAFLIKIKHFNQEIVSEVPWVRYPIPAA